MNSSFNRDEVEVDLIQFLKRLCEQWKAVVAVALVCGVVVMAGKYAMDVKSYNASKAAEENYDIDAAKESMSESDYAAVCAALKTQEEIDGLNTYISNSLYMNVDALNYNQVRMTYKVEASGDETAANVIAAYRECILSDEVLNRVKTNLGAETEAKYLRDIIHIDAQSTETATSTVATSTITNSTTVNDSTTVNISEGIVSNTDGMVISMELPKEMDSEVAKTVLRDAFEEASEFMDSYGYQYSISLVSESVENCSDLTMLQSQKELINQLTMLKTTQSTALSKLSGEQTALYNALLKEEKDNSQNTVVDKEDATDENVIVSTVSPSIKYFAIGVVFGICAYALLFFLYIVLNPLAVELTVAGVTTLPCVGWLKKESTPSELENIIGTMQMYSGSEETKRFQILLPKSGNKEEDSNTIDALLNAGKNLGIEISATIVDVSNRKVALENIDNAIATVVAVFEKKTKKADVCACHEMLLNQKIKDLGELYIKTV